MRTPAPCSSTSSRCSTPTSSTRCASRWSGRSCDRPRGGDRDLPGPGDVRDRLQPVPVRRLPPDQPRQPVHVHGGAPPGVPQEDQRAGRGPGDHRAVEPVRAYEVHDPARPETPPRCGRSRPPASARRSATAGTGWLNADVPGPVLRERWPLTDEADRLLTERVYAGELTRRGATRVHRLAWTVTDLRGGDRPASTRSTWGCGSARPAADARHAGPARGRHERARRLSRFDPAERAGGPAAGHPGRAAGRQRGLHPAPRRAGRRRGLHRRGRPAPRARPERELDDAARKGIRFVCPEDDEWPAALDDLDRCETLQSRAVRRWASGCGVAPGWTR